MTPMSPNGVHEDLEGIGPACVDRVDSREVEHHQPLAREQVAHSVYRRSGRRGQCPAERGDASVGLTMEVDHQRRDRRFGFG